MVYCGTLIRFVLQNCFDVSFIGAETNSHVFARQLYLSLADRFEAYVVEFL